MPSRRSFLQSVLFLPSAVAAQAFAQDAQSTKGGTTVFADFESRNWQDWMVEGDAFASSPATDTLFPGKIGGFGGRGFVCTLHPKKGNAATGKAVSREFVIDKPFITFKIGGGNHPNQACLNLVVEGQVVRTATGTGSPNLLEASWDVSELVGKTARFEIIDTTASENRGYIMVDDIGFAERPRMRPQDMLERRGITPRFLQDSHFFQNDEERTNGRWLDFGVSESELDSLIRSIWILVGNSRYSPYADISVETIAGWVTEMVGVVAKTQKPLSELGRQWLLAEAIGAWCTIYVVRDTDMDKAILRGEQVNTRDTQYPINVLHHAPPKAICNGYSLVIRDVARKLGLTCYILKGYLRGVDSKDPLAGKHQWNVFIFPGNIFVPTDGTPGTMGDVIKHRNKIFPYAKLPRRREEWELYHASYFNLSPIPWPLLFGDPKESFVLLDMTLEDWCSINLKSYEPLFQRLRFP